MTTCGHGPINGGLACELGSTDSAQATLRFQAGTFQGVEVPEEKSDTELEVLSPPENLSRTPPGRRGKVRTQHGQKLVLLEGTPNCREQAGSQEALSPVSDVASLVTSPRRASYCPRQIIHLV